MNQQSGMRPQDVVVLLKISISQEGWLSKDLARDLLLSPAEISYSLQRSVIGGLIDDDKKKVLRRTFLEFIRYGLPHVFPVTKGAMVKGVPTAFSAPVLSKYLVSNEYIVWPYAEGSARGESINPLYPNAVMAALRDKELYALLAVVDVMRLGKVREKEIAVNYLRKKLDV